MQELELEALATAFDRAHGVPSLEAHQLKKAIESGQRLLLVDVRTKKEQEVSQIAGAVLLRPKNDPWQNPKIREFIEKNRTKERQASSREEAKAQSQEASWIVFYCAVGARSGEAAARLLTKKEKIPKNIKVYNLHGGIFLWANAGYPLIHPATKKPTHQVHGYNLKWAQFLRPPARAVLDPAESK